MEPSATPGPTAPAAPPAAIPQVAMRGPAQNDATAPAYLEPLNPAEAGVGRQIAPLLAPERADIDFSPVSHFDLGDAGSALAASFQLESWMATMWRVGHIESNMSGEYDPNFNPYSYLKDKLTPEQLQQIEPAIRSGVFDDAGTPRDVSRQFQNWQQEQALHAEAAKSAAGSAAGNVLAMATDPLNWAGAGMGFGIKGAGLGASALKFALQGGLTTAAQETILSQLQASRDIHDSLINVGSNFLFAGGLGALAGAFEGGAVGKGILSLANGLDAVTGRVGREAAPTVLNDMLSRAGAGGDLGAAATAPGNAPVDLMAPAPTKAYAQGFGGAVARRMDDVMGAFSPVYRMLDATSDAARNMMFRLNKMGPIALAKDGSLVPTPASAEELALLHEAQFTEPAMNAYTGARQSASETLAGLGRAKVDPLDFNEAVARNLDGRAGHEVSDEFNTRLGQTYGDDGAAAVLKHAQDAADGIRAVNAQVEQKLIDAGVIRDQGKLDGALDRLAQLRQAHEANVARLNQSIAVARQAATRGTEAAPEAASAYDALVQELKDARAQYATDKAPHESIRDAQMAKQEPLGAKYGYAQLYDRGAISLHMDDFRDLLLRKMAGRPYDGWLREQHGLSPDAFDKLAESDPAQHAEITKAWAGDEYYVKLEQAQQRLRAAESRHDLSKADLYRTSYYQGQAEQNLGRDAVAVARTERARRVAARDTAMAERAQAKTDAEALKNAAEAARQQTLDRASAELVDRPDVGEKELLEAIRKGRTAAAARTRALQDPVTAELERLNPGTVENAGDVGPKLQRAQAAADRATAEPLEAPKVPEPQASARAARLQGRADVLEKRIAELDRQVGDHSAKMSELDEAMATFEQSRASRQAAKDNLDAAVAEAKRQRNLSAKNIAQLKAQLIDAKNKPAITDVVDGIINDIMSSGHLPSGTSSIDASKLIETGRVKERMIHYEPAEREQLAKMGILRDDLPGIIRSSNKALGAHLGIHEALGIGTPGGYSSFGDAVKAVTEDYRQRIADAPTPAAKQALVDEQKQSMQDIALMRDRLVNADLSGVADKNTAWFWGTNLLKKMNLVKYIPGFGVSSLTHFAAGALHYSFGDLLKAGAAKWAGTLKGADADTLSAIVHATDAASHGSHDFSALTGEELMHQMGIGDRGSRAHIATATVDRAMDWLQNKAAWASGLPKMIQFSRTLAGIASMQKMATKLGDWGALSAADKMHFAILGLDEAKAGRLNSYLQQFGTKDPNGFHNPNIDTWGTSADARAAQRDFHLAISRDVASANPTRSVGDLPRFMSTHIGSLLTQFQGWNFQAYNKFIAPAIQKLTYTGDFRMFGALMATVPLTAMNFLVRDLSMGKNPMDRYAPGNAAQTMYDYTDRAGLLGYLSPYTDAAMKLAGLQGSGARYHDNNWYQSLGGAPLSMAVNAAKTVGAARDTIAGQPNGLTNLGKQAATVAPFGLYARFATRLLPTTH